MFAVLPSFFVFDSLNLVPSRSKPTEGEIHKPTRKRPDFYKQGRVAWVGGKDRKRPANVLQGGLVN